MVKRFSVSLNTKPDQMSKIAVFPGSFDPVTKGHESIVRRALPLFDKIYVAVGINSSKHYLFPLEKRLAWLDQVFADAPQVEVVSYEGMTIDFCKTVQSRFLLRGLRNGTDFEYEKSIAQMNLAMNHDIETILYVTKPELSAINSTIIRELIKHKQDVSHFLPDKIKID